MYYNQYKEHFMKLVSVFFPVILMILVIGCAKPPLEEMQNAQEAVFRAENDANAALYAGGTLARARAALQQMQIEADNKRYNAVKDQAAEAVSLAERAILEGKMAADRVKDESASLITNLREEINETERNVNGARYSQLDLDYNELEKGIKNAHESADKVEGHQAEGNYQGALNGARELRSDLSNMNEKIAGAAVVKKK